LSMISTSHASSFDVVTHAAVALERRHLVIASRRSQERTRIIISVLGLLAFLSGLLLLGHVSGLTPFALRPSPTEPAVVDVPDQSFYKTRTGQVVFVPLKGNICLRSRFNNETGRFSEDEQIPCSDVLPQGTPDVDDEGYVAARMGALRDAFTKR